MMRFSEKYSKSSQISSGLQDLFKKNEIETLACETGFVKRASELTGHKFVHICIDSITKKGLMGSLSELCTVAMKLDANLCEQSLNERFNLQGVELMKLLFGKTIQQRFDESSMEILGAFSEVMLEDATTIELPEHLEILFRGSGGAASKAALKIDLTYNFKAAKFRLLLRSARQPDVSVGLPEVIKPGGLWLRDLGYFKMEDLEAIHKAQAFYVSRMKYSVKVYLSEQKQAQAIDLLALLKKMKPNEVKDMRVFIGKEKRMPVRLILQKVPKGIADLKRKKMRTDKHKKCKNLSKGRLEFCDANAFITNLEEEEWTPYQVMKLYKIRWQIEILFKVWKSILKIGKVQKMKADRFLCLLYSQLIWAVINMKIFQSFKNYFWNEVQIEISELKSYKIMSLFKNEFTRAIHQNCGALYEQCLNEMYRAIAVFGKKYYKKGNPNPAFNIEKNLT